MSRQIRRSAKRSIETADEMQIGNDWPTGENKFDRHRSTGENKSKHETFRANQLVRTSLIVLFSPTSTAEKQVPRLNHPLISVQPYRPPADAAAVPTEQTLRCRWGLLMIVAPFVLYPVLAVLSVYLVCFMDLRLGMRGAKLGSFATPLGIAFNVAAILNIGFFVWMPVGFVASFFVRDAIRPDARRFPFVLTYLLLCAFAVTLVLIDPGGYFEYFHD